MFTNANTSQESTLMDVLSGKNPIKAEVSISAESIGILCLAVLAVVVFSTLFIKKFS